MVNYHLKEDDDKDIAFAVSCLFCQCLTLDEFKVWLENIIRESDVDDIPSYIFDLLDFDGPLADIFSIIGFDPIWPFDDKAENALYGISYKRNTVIIEDFGLSRKESEELLNKYPEVDFYFRKLFDFISF
ncbi:hypothetical protein ACFODT_11440 [Vibrio zhugei]|uniref:Uncharacterized protein n=1 Tax=Vibrio zhugei TaxID=2479546 RepID=A0ABV7C8U5_9VIBR|nr:hypothetical protein [Vibrio zhugei]